VRVFRSQPDAGRLAPGHQPMAVVLISCSRFDPIGQP